MVPGSWPCAFFSLQSVSDRGGTSRGYQSWAGSQAGRRKSREQRMYFMSPAVASLAARHDLEVLQGTARSLATLPPWWLQSHGTRWLAVDSSTRHFGRAHSGSTPLETEREEGGNVGQEGSTGAGPCHCHALPSPHSHPYLLWSSPHRPRPPDSATPISR